MANSLSRASSREGSATGRGLELWAAGADSVSCLLGQLKASSGGTTTGATGDVEDEGGDRETGRGEGVFFRGGDGGEKLKLRS